MSIDDPLAEFDSADSEEAEALSRVLEKVLCDLEQGKPFNPQELLDEHQQLADRLRPCLDGLQLLAVPPATRRARPKSERELGEYILQREVGRGGMGTVYEAVSRSNGERVALKTIPLSAALDERQLVRFKNETEAAARLRHPHIVPIVEVGCAGGVHFYTMKFIDGESLTAFIHRQRHSRTKLSLDDPAVPNGELLNSGHFHNQDYLMSAAKWMIQASDAIDHAHQVGVIHRDIKPANLLIDQNANLWVTDFGLASIQGSDGLTATGDVLGTVRYMSPEQASARRGVVDHRTDIYSLGVTLYELLTLEPAIDGRDRQEMLARLSQWEPTAPRRLNPNIPFNLETIVLKAISKSPQDRYPTAKALADDLRRFVSGEAIVARRSGFSTQISRWARQNRGWVIAISLFVLMATLGSTISTVLIWFAWRAEEQQRALAESREFTSRSHLYAANMHLALTKWDQGNVASVFELLRQHEPQDGAIDLRGFEWFSLWHRATHARRRTRDGHAAPVCAIATAAATVVSGDEQGGVLIWDPTSGQIRKKLSVPGGAIRSVSLSADGARLAMVGGDQKVRIWRLDDATTPTLELTHPNISPTIAIAMSNDGRKIVSGSEDHRVQCWNGVSGELLWESPMQPSHLTCVAITPDGALAASSGHGRVIHLWDLTTFSDVPVELGKHRSYVTCLEFGPDGQTLLSGSEDGMVNLWNVHQKSSILAAPQRCHTGGVAGLAFSADGTRIATVSWNGAVRIWDSRFVSLELQQGHAGNVLAVDFSADGRSVLTGGDDGLVHCWDAAARDEPLVLDGHQGLVRSLAFSEDGRRLLSGGNDGTIRYWDLVSGQQLNLFRIENSTKLPTWSLPPGDAAFGGNTNWIMGVCFLPATNECIAADFGGRVHCWHLASDSCRQFEEAGCPIWSLAMSADATTLAAAGYTSNRITRWEIATGRRLPAFTEHGDRVWSVQFAPHSQTLISSAADGMIRLWDQATSRATAIPLMLNYVYSMDFSPDGRFVALAGEDRKLRVLDVQTGKPQQTFLQNSAVFRSVAYFPNGKTIAAAGDDGEIKLWDLLTQRERASFRGTDGSIWSIAVAPAGDSLAAADNDGRILVWRTSTVVPNKPVVEH